MTWMLAAPGCDLKYLPAAVEDATQTLTITLSSTASAAWPRQEGKCVVSNMSPGNTIDWHNGFTVDVTIDNQCDAAIWVGFAYVDPKNAVLLDPKNPGLACIQGRQAAPGRTMLGQCTISTNACVNVEFLRSDLIFTPTWRSDGGARSASDCDKSGQIEIEPL
ncbi:MAG TPA: hypothetical protein VGN09_06590 [Vicinamibacteria bacterium]|jgi:hypothetical protein